MKTGSVYIVHHMAINSMEKIRAGNVERECWGWQLIVILNRAERGALW